MTFFRKIRVYTYLFSLHDIDDATYSHLEANSLLDNSIGQRLHFMPQLIESSMRSDTTKQEGEEGKKYHTHAHFNVTTADAINMYFMHWNWNVL